MSSRSTADGPPISPFSSSRRRRHVPWPAIAAFAGSLAAAAVAALLIFG